MADIESKPIELDRGSLATIHVAAKEKMRYSLNAILVTREETVATDGRILIRTAHPTPIGIGNDDSEFPEAGLLIPRETAANILKGLDKKVKSRRKPWSRIVLSEAESGKAEFNLPAGSDGVSRVDETVPILEGTFPQWQEVLPTAGSESVTVCINAKYLAQIVKACEETTRAEDCDQGYTKIKIRIPAESLWGEGEAGGRYVCSPIRIDGGSGRVSAVIMPIDLG